MTWISISELQVFSSTDFYKSIRWGEVDFCAFLVSTSLQNIFIILLSKGPFPVLKSFYIGFQPVPKSSLQQPQSPARSLSPLVFSFLLMRFPCLLVLCSSFILPQDLTNFQIPLSFLLFLNHCIIWLFEFVTPSQSLSLSTGCFFLCLGFSLERIITYNKCLTTSGGVQPTFPSCTLIPIGRHFKKL